MLAASLRLQSDPVSDSTGRPNRLAKQSSPYLLLHQFNPVDWYPWGEEALQRARDEDRPIFLSVGYSTCYWCHVMERESFSDERVAEVMNREFINIKMDREERPELDEIYMVATQVLTGHGGWPNSLFLTPDLEPFFAGTYFPPEDRHGQPAFLRVLLSLADAWTNRRDDIREQARSVTASIQHYLDRRAAPAPTVPSPAVADTSARALAQRFDSGWGGFGGAPKFPTPANLFLLQERAADHERDAEMLVQTLDQMARGGIYDQLGGGFHRYATDAEWKIPHFEKMLYDNGLLLELYAREFGRGGDPEMARVVRETAAYLEREMSAPEGFFWSAQDAETDGEEGAFYVWTRDQLQEVLGSEDFGFLAPLMGFDGPPFFEGDHFVLHLPKPLAVQAELRRMTLDELVAEMAPMRRRLFEARQARDLPATDDKILVDWNGMVVGGLATAGRLLAEPALVERAGRAASAILDNLRPDGTLLHAWRAGSGSVRAFLSDYAFLVRGLLALHEATGDDRWLEAASDLSDEQQERLGDRLGGFFNAAEDAELLVRAKEVVDGAVPAANAVAILNLIDLAEQTGEERWRIDAEAGLRAFATQIEQSPDAARMMSVAVLRLGMPGPQETSGTAGQPAETPMRAQARDAVRPSLRFGKVDEEGWRTFRLDLEVAEGLHIQANPASSEFVIPTELSFSDLEARGVAYPEGEALATAFAEEDVRVYGGVATIAGELKGEGSMHLTFQACTDVGCLPPVRLDFSVGTEDSEDDVTA